MRICFMARALIVSMGVSLLMASARAEWTPPKDKLLTEKQVTSYIAVMNALLADQKAAEKATQGQSGLAALAVVKQLSDKHKASLAAHGMSEEEFGWVCGAVTEAKAASFRDQMAAKLKSDLDAQLKSNQDKIAEMKKTLAVYQKAQTEGRRVMTPDERKSAIDSATEDQKGALDEAKQHADEMKSAQAEVDKALADEKAAEAALKNPPKFDSDDDKNAFLEEKKNAIQSAKDAQKEASDKLAEAKKAEAESQGKAAAAAARVKNPDLPASDDDKAAVKQQNDDKLKELAENIKQTEDGNKLIQDAGKQQLQIFGDEKDRPPEQNIALFKKHEKEYDDMLGLNQKK